MANTNPSDSREKPMEIPPGVSAVRFMVGQAKEQPYVSFPTIEDARKHPDAALVMEADYGGQILLTCPVSKVHCTESVLKQLLHDLGNITWGDGGLAKNDAADDGNEGYYFEALPVGSGVAGGMGGGVVLDDLWIHNELEKYGLRSQIKAVIAGTQARLVLHGIVKKEDVDLKKINRAEVRHILNSKIITDRDRALIRFVADSLRLGKSERDTTLELILNGITPPAVDAFYHTVVDGIKAGIAAATVPSLSHARNQKKGTALWDAAFEEGRRQYGGTFLRFWLRHPTWFSILMVLLVVWFIFSLILLLPLVILVFVRLLAR